MIIYDIGAPILAPTCVEYLETLKEMCGVEVYAYIWMQQVIQTALVWDHIYDDDNLDKDALDNAIRTLVTEWPVNPFLKRYAEMLMPVMTACINAWQANISRDLDYSVYREIPRSVAFILGGESIVAEYMPRIEKLVKQMQKEDDVRDAN